MDGSLAPHSVQWIASSSLATEVIPKWTASTSCWIINNKVSYFHRKASDLRTRNTTSFKATSLRARRPPRRKIPCWINHKVLEHNTVTHIHTPGAPKAVRATNGGWSGHRSLADAHGQFHLGKEVRYYYVAAHGGKAPQTAITNV
eukprot:scaffold76046_cov73-Phaeocystis_antarctica.AAC.3